MEIDSQYTRTIEKLSDAIYICDTSGYIKFYNKAAVNLWGRVPEVDKDLFCGSWKITNKDGTRLPRENSPMAITLKEKRSVQGAEIIIQRPDGSSRLVIPYSSLLYNVRGEFAGAVNMLIDITEKNESNKMGKNN
jgi:PAS domain-containing protein